LFRNKQNQPGNTALITCRHIVWAVFCALHREFVRFPTQFSMPPDIPLFIGFVGVVREVRGSISFCLLIL
jgi:hypothetical protein